MKKIYLSYFFTLISIQFSYFCSAENSIFDDESFVLLSEDTLRQCGNACNKVQEILDRSFEIEDSLTLICEKIIDTYSIIDEINNTFTVEVTGIYTALAELEPIAMDTSTILCDKFAQTWTILVPINNEIIDTNTTLCLLIAETFTALDSILNITVIDSLFAATWTILGCLDEVSIVGPITITQPGTYCVRQDFTGAIVIDADKVVLDLNQKTIRGGASKISAAGHSDITIINGTLEGATLNEILISAADNVTIKDIDFIGDDVNTAAGITIATTTGIHIENCTFRQRIIADMCFLDNVNSVKVKDCLIQESVNAPFRIQNGACIELENIKYCNNTAGTAFSLTRVANCSFTNCHCDHNNSNSTIIGFFLSLSSNINFQNCTCNNNVATGITGFSVSSTRNCTFFGCQANKNSVGNSTSAGFSSIGGDPCISFFNCSCINNSTTGNFSGFSLASSAHILQDCQVNNNQSAGATVNGFLLSGNDGVVKNCIATNNLASGGSPLLSVYNISGENILVESCIAGSNSCTNNDLRAFSALGNNGCFVNCIAKNNSSGDVCVGFRVFGTQDIVLNCIAEENVGATTSNGFERGGTNNVILRNQAQGHGASGATNYVSVAAGTIATFSPTTGFSGNGSYFNNISVNAP